MFAQELLVNLPAEQAYHALLSYFHDGPLPGFRVLHSTELSYIEAKFGSPPLVSVLSPVKSFGTVKLTITPRDDKSQSLIDYDLVKFLAAWFIVYLALGLFLYFVARSIVFGVGFLLYYVLDMWRSINRLRNLFRSGVSSYLKSVEQAHRPVS
jgi:hypothetical protein